MARAKQGEGTVNTKQKLGGGRSGWTSLQLRASLVMAAVAIGYADQHAAPPVDAAARQATLESIVARGPARITAPARQRQGAFRSSGQVAGGRSASRAAGSMLGANRSAAARRFAFLPRNMNCWTRRPPILPYSISKAMLGGWRSTRQPGRSCWCSTWATVATPACITSSN